MTEVRALPEWSLAVRFQDGLEGRIDLRALIFGTDAGVLAALRDPDLFALVGLHWGAATWPNGLDLAPDAMHAQVRQTGLR